MKKKNYPAEMLRVCKIKDLSWVIRFQSPKVYIYIDLSSDQMLSVPKTNNGKSKRCTQFPSLSPCYKYQSGRDSECLFFVYDYSEPFMA